eukprot:TRINITY_DN5087_c0_g1_i1.p1 TRINITY_DN5087_c0_g1~~TRINITY_DN5087_c0_g1_i1.p1  ORF type:complete len:591 (+),score=49.54 TRINITY_DN5087_c0_g1_i1:44-1816(+)
MQQILLRTLAIFVLLAVSQGSHVPNTMSCAIDMLIDGRDFIGRLESELSQAKEEILIASWKLNQRLILRGLQGNETAPFTLIDLFTRKIKEGIKIYVLGWMNTHEYFLGKKSNYTSNEISRLESAGVTVLLDHGNHFAHDNINWKSTISVHSLHMVLHGEIVSELYNDGFARTWKTLCDSKFFFNKPASCQRSPPESLKVVSGGHVDTGKKGTCKLAPFGTTSSTGLGDHSEAAFDAWTELILQAKKYIYIEHEYLFDTNNKNKWDLVSILRKRILAAIEKQEIIKVYIIVPFASARPEYMNKTYEDLIFKENSLFNVVREEITKASSQEWAKELTAEDYLSINTILKLQTNHSTKTFEAFPIAVKSNVVIVDDQRMVFGPTGVHHTLSSEDGHTYLNLVIGSDRTNYPKMARINLMREHLGLIESKPYADRDTLLDRADNDDLFKDLWLSMAHWNRDFISEKFHFKDLKKLIIERKDDCWRPLVSGILTLHDYKEAHSVEGRVVSLHPQANVQINSDMGWNLFTWNMNEPLSLHLFLGITLCILRFLVALCLSNSNQRDKPQMVPMNPSFKKQEVELDHESIIQMSAIQ